MTEEVLVSIRGLHTSGPGQQDNIEVIFPGTCKKIHDTWYIAYDEPVEGTDEEIHNLIKIRDKSMEVTRRGLTNTCMVFEEEKRSMTWYDTPFGRLVLEIYGTNVRVEETAQYIRAEVEYELEINSQHMSNCSLRVNVSSRQPESSSARLAETISIADIQSESISADGTGTQGGTMMP